MPSCIWINEVVFFFLSISESTVHWKHMFLYYGIVTQYLQARLFSAVSSSETGGEGSGKRWWCSGQALFIPLQFQEKFLCVFCKDRRPPLKPAKDLCHGGGSPILSHLSWDLMLVNERIPTYQYKTAVDQAQGHIEPGVSKGLVLERTWNTIRKKHTKTMPCCLLWVCVLTSVTA